MIISSRFRCGRPRWGLSQWDMAWSASNIKNIFVLLPRFDELRLLVPSSAKLWIAGVQNAPQYPAITYYNCTVHRILDHSNLVGNLTNSKIAETKALKPLKSWHFCISNFRSGPRLEALSNNRLSGVLLYNLCKSSWTIGTWEAINCVPNKNTITNILFGH